VEVGLKRKKQNGIEWNRMDAHEVEFYQRVRAGYLEMVKEEPNRWVVVDASKSWDDVQQTLRQVILHHL
jgi:dTMP kinase